MNWNSQERSYGFSKWYNLLRNFFCMFLTPLPTIIAAIQIKYSIFCVLLWNWFFNLRYVFRLSTWWSLENSQTVFFNNSDYDTNHFLEFLQNGIFPLEFGLSLGSLITRSKQVSVAKRTLLVSLYLIRATCRDSSRKKFNTRKKNYNNRDIRVGVFFIAAFWKYNCVSAGLHRKAEYRRTVGGEGGIEGVQEIWIIHVRNFGYTFTHIYGSFSQKPARKMVSMRGARERQEGEEEKRWTE